MHAARLLFVISGSCSLTRTCCGPDESSLQMCFLFYSMLSRKDLVDIYVKNTVNTEPYLVLLDHLTDVIT